MPASTVAPLIAPPAEAVIKDVTLANFVAEVIEPSRAQIVIVNFWAPRSGPCMQFTPLLEKLTRASKGTVRLAKIDIDRNPEIAHQMGVQSVPAVFAFFQGRPVDGFMGALPEAQVKSWIERLLKLTGGAAGAGDDGFDTALKQAEEFLVAQDVATAQSIYADLLAEAPDHAGAYAGFVRCLIALGRTAEAQKMLDQAPESVAKDKALAAVRTALDLAHQAASAGAATEELTARLAKDPADHAARFDLAMAHYARGQREQAVDELLEIVRRNRAWTEEAARTQLVKFFEAFGPIDPLTISARKRLSSLLFA